MFPLTGVVATPYHCGMIATEQIGAWLYDHRKARHLSREQAAVHVGVTYKTIANWERGDVAPPADKFLDLCFLYRADPTEIIGLAKKATGARRVG